MVQYTFKILNSKQFIQPWILFWADGKLHISLKSLFFEIMNYLQKQEPMLDTYCIYFNFMTNKLVILYFHSWKIYSCDCLFLVLLTMQKRCLQKVLVFMNSELTYHTWVYFTQSLHLIQDEKLYLCFCNSSSLKSSKSKRFLFRNQSGRMTLITLSFCLHSRLKHHIQVKCSSKMLTKYSFFSR